MKKCFLSLSLLVAMGGALSTMSVVSSCCDDKVSYISGGNENLPQAEVNLSGKMIQISGLKGDEEVLVTIEDEGGTKSLMRASVLGSLRLVSVKGGIEITEELLNFIREQSKGKTLTLVFLHVYVGGREVCQKICVVMIIGNGVSVESVSLDKDTLILAPESNAALTATVLPENAGNKNVSWKSTNPAVATVGQDGKVTGVAEGVDTVIVTTEEGAKTDTCIVIVSDPDLLPGKFTVNDQGKQVRFTISNLCYRSSGSGYFEISKYLMMIYSTEWADWITHFFWISSSNYESYKPYSTSYLQNMPLSPTDEFWCGEENPLTVRGTEGRLIEGLYVLDSAEWAYLLNKDNSDNCRKNRCKWGVNVDGKSNCLIIAPDDFSGALKGSYTLDEVNSLGLVCLLSAGYRDGDAFAHYEAVGYYWTSTCHYNDNSKACCLVFSSNGYNMPYTFNEMDKRSYGFSIRLVKNAE